MCKTSSTEVITHDNFNAGFFEASLKANGNADNYVASPLSVLVLLSALITSKGARNETAEEICNAVVGFRRKDECQKLDYPDVEAMLNNIRTSVRQSKETLKLSNAIFLQAGVQFCQKFKDRFAKNKDDVKSTLFNTSKAYQDINKWARDATDNLIEEYLKSKDELSADTIMVLLNAIAFTGKWETTFVEKRTKMDDFHLSNGEIVKTLTMHSENRMVHLDEAGFEVVAKTFSENRFLFAVFLSKERFDLGKIESALKGSQFKWEKLRDAQLAKQIHLALPKFKINHEMNLIPILNRLGVKRLFTRGMAQLTGISRNLQLYAGDAKQVAVMEVNETGVEVAAVSGASIVPTSEISSTPFIVNSPFYCAIYDLVLKMPLFLARVVEPR